MKNIFSNIPAQLSEELTETLLKGPHLAIERIISRGHTSPPGFWYDQALNEWVTVLKGRAKLRFKDAEQTLLLGPGDHVMIRAHRKHRVEWTATDTETVWLAVHWDGEHTD